MLISKWSIARNTVTGISEAQDRPHMWKIYTADRKALAAQVLDANQVPSIGCTSSWFQRSKGSTAVIQWLLLLLLASMTIETLGFSEKHFWGYSPALWLLRAVEEGAASQFPGQAV